MSAVYNSKINGNESDVTTLVPNDFETKKEMLRSSATDAGNMGIETAGAIDAIVNSFRRELESVINLELKHGYHPTKLSTLQQITELLLLKRSFGFCPGHRVIPINDLRGAVVSKYTEMEKQLRCKLACVYRLIDLHKLSQFIYNHVTVRASQTEEHFLLNPFGLRYAEVTASSLLKVDMDGNVIDPGSTSFTFNRAGFVLHSAIHTSRPDINAIIHIHHPPCVAVSSMKTGLLPISQETALIGDVSYHDYEGIVIDTNYREAIARDLGPVNKVMILRNHGVVVMGETLEEAMFYLHNVVLACEAQVRLMSIGVDKIQVMPDEARKRVRSIITDNHSEVTGRPDCPLQKESEQDFKVWDLEFESQVRMLDDAGLQTGYMYKYSLPTALPYQANETSPDMALFLEYMNKTKSPMQTLMEDNKAALDISKLSI